MTWRIPAGIIILMMLSALAALWAAYWVPPQEIFPFLLWLGGTGVVSLPFFWRLVAQLKELRKFTFSDNEHTELLRHRISIAERFAWVRLVLYFFSSAFVGTIAFYSDRGGNITVLLIGLVGAFCGLLLWSGGSLVLDYFRYDRMENEHRLREEHVRKLDEFRPKPASTVKG